AISGNQLRELASKWTRPLDNAPGESIFDLRSELEDLMWEKVGVVRNGADLAVAIEALGELRARAARAAAAGEAASNPAWNEVLDMLNLCVNGEMVARAALLRTESRGAHYRQDYPDTNPEWLKNI